MQSLQQILIVPGVVAYVKPQRSGFRVLLDLTQPRCERAL